MAYPTTPAARLQVIALHEAKVLQKQIASQLGIHPQTVSSIIRKHDLERKSKDAAAIATRDDILRRMTKIMYDADKATDTIAAARLIAQMEGWLIPQQEAQINVNILGNADVTTLESEYKSLTGRDLASNAISIPPSGTKFALSEAEKADGGADPPGADGNGI